MFAVAPEELDDGKCQIQYELFAVHCYTKN